jgi:hypothetical protein
MGSFWILIIAGILIGAYLGFKILSFNAALWEKIGMVLICSFIGLIIGGFVTVFVGAIYTSGATDCEWKRIEVSGYDLSSLDDGVSASGEFFLGCGTIEGKLNYFGYRELHEGVFENVSISSDNTYIYQSDTVTIPRVEVWRADKVLDDTWFLSLYGNNFTKIYVPTGTIKTTYSLDSK